MHSHNSCPLKASGFHHSKVYPSLHPVLPVCYQIAHLNKSSLKYFFHLSHISDSLELIKPSLTDVCTTSCSDIICTFYITALCCFSASFARLSVHTNLYLLKVFLTSFSTLYSTYPFRSYSIYLLSSTLFQLSPLIHS